MGGIRRTRDTVPRRVALPRWAAAHRLEEVASRLEGLSRSPALTALRPNSLQIPPPGSRPTPLPSDMAETLSELARSHVLKSYQDVLDLYGRPDSVWPNQATLNWTYKREDGSTIIFTFQEGLVVRVSL